LAPELVPGPYERTFGGFHQTRPPSAKPTKRWGHDDKRDNRRRLSTLKYIRMRLRPALCLELHWGSLQRSPEYP